MSDTARGRPSGLDPVPLLTGDRWFELQGGLRVFGSRVARHEFDSLMQAAWQLRALEAAASQGHPAAAGDVEDALRELRLHAARLRTAVSAEIGPLYDILDRTPPRWWRPSPHARRDTAATSAATAARFNVMSSADRRRPARFTAARALAHQVLAGQRTVRMVISSGVGLDAPTDGRRDCAGVR